MKSIIYATILMVLMSFTTPLKSQTYCASKGVFPWENWIARVSLAPANVGNNSFKDGYGNFTAVTGFTVKRGSNNLFTIDPKASWNNDPRNANIFWRVWIDYNGDGDFTDADEQVISRQVVFTQGIFLDNENNFIVPTTARLGNTRLRVAMKVGGYPLPCETFDRGEVEDYTLAITDGSTTNCRYQDSLQLVSLYNATNPSTWLHKWNLNTPLNTWYGVALTAEGCVFSVNLENNTMVGTNLPTLNMPNLDFLNLRNNVLSGTIPNVNCPKLTGLLLAANQFTGTIPNYNCPNMQNLFLYGNQLTGTIPPFNYPNIVKLLLDGNQLTGTIPPFNAPFMNHFAVSFNRLTGSIPNFNFPVIDKLFLDNNQLSGCIPASFSAFCGRNVSFINNPNLATQDFTAFCANNTGACNENYCRSKGTAPWELWIAKVQLGTINNTSEKFKDFANYGYSDYTNLSTTVTRGMTTTLTVTPGLSWTGHLPNVYCRAWIDYNGNKIFEPSELVFQNTNANPFTAAIRLPNALAATARMRVALKWGSYPEPCETFDRGEVEDYTLNFQTGTAIINPPILALEAHADLDNAQLMWVSNQSDVDYFEIYKANEQGVFNKIGVQKGIKNADLNAYLFTDARNTEGSYFYLIKAVTYNGLSQNSDIKSIKIKGVNNLEIFPNPVSDEISMVLKNYQNVEAKVFFYNSLGLIIKTISLDKINSNLIKTDVNDFPTGHYYVRVIANGKRDLIQRFMIVR